MRTVGNGGERLRRFGERSAVGFSISVCGLLMWSLHFSFCNSTSDRVLVFWVRAALLGAEICSGLHCSGRSFLQKIGSRLWRRWFCLLPNSLRILKARLASSWWMNRWTMENDPEPNHQEHPNIIINLLSELRFMFFLLSLHLALLRVSLWFSETWTSKWGEIMSCTVRRWKSGISRTSQCRGGWCYFFFNQILVNCGGDVSRRRAALAFPDWHAIWFDLISSCSAFWLIIRSWREKDEKRKRGKERRTRGGVIGMGLRVSCFFCLISSSMRCGVDFWSTSWNL